MCEMDTPDLHVLFVYSDSHEVVLVYRVSPMNHTFFYSAYSAVATIETHKPGSVFRYWLVLGSDAQEVLS